MTKSAHEWLPALPIKKYYSFLCPFLLSGSTEPKRSDSDELNDILAMKKKRIRTEKVKRTRHKNPSIALLNDVKDDFKHYEAKGQRSELLELLKKSLLSIPPSSVEAGKYHLATLAELLNYY